MPLVTGQVHEAYLKAFLSKKDMIKRVFPDKITPEIARIHAHICGDGYVYEKKEKYSLNQLERHPRRNLNEIVWLIEYTNTCNKLLDEFNADLRIAFKRKGDRKSVV